MKKILASILVFALCFSSAEAQNRYFSQARFHQPVTASPGDADSAAYVNALISAGYTPSSTEKTAVGRLISDWKGRSNGSYATSDIWTSLVKVAYPVLGSTAAAHAINLRSSSYVVTWNGTVTHTSNYYQGDGSTGYGNTGFNPSGILSSAQGTLLVYIKTMVAGDGVHDQVDIGSSNGTNANILVVSTSPDEVYGQITDGFDFPFLSITPTAGIFSVAATSASALNLYKTGSSISSYTTTRVTTQPNLNVYLCAGNYSSSPSSFSKNIIGFAVIANGTNSTQNLLLYNSINAFNTTIGK